MSTTIADVIKLAREGVELKGKNATMPSGQTDLEAELEKVRAASRTMRSQITTR